MSILTGMAERLAAAIRRAAPGDPLNPKGRKARTARLDYQRPQRASETVRAGQHGRTINVPREGSWMDSNLRKYRIVRIHSKHDAKRLLRTELHRVNRLTPRTRWRNGKRVTKGHGGQA